MRSYNDLLTSIVNKYLGCSNEITVRKLHSIKFEDFSFIERTMIMKSFIECNEALAKACIIQEHAKRISVDIYTGGMDLFYIEAIASAVNDDINKYASKVQKKLSPRRTIITKIKDFFGVAIKKNLDKLLKQH